MATRQPNKPTPKKSKRARRQTILVWIMIIAMLLSALTAGLVYFI